MSHPPKYPGRQRLKRAAASAGGGAYEGAFEAVGAILVATGIGYWVDHRFETTPYGVVIGAAIGFAAFVLRLVRLGRQLHPDTLASDQEVAAPDEVGAGRDQGHEPGPEQEAQVEREGAGVGAKAGAGESGEAATESAREGSREGGAGQERS